MYLDAGTTCWRIETADRAAVILDMADYFTAAKAAMLKARRSIHLLNWAFDPDTLFEPQPHPEPKGGGRDDDTRIGPFLKRLSEEKPDLDIRILCWKASLPISATQNFFTLKDRHCFAGSSVNMKLDGRLPFGASHHQKMIVIDDRVAFCGGGDIAPDRWDTACHEDHDPRRFRKKGKCYPSRHELMSAVEGPPAAALGELFRDRWVRATGEALAPVESPPKASPWPACLKAEFQGVRTGLSRTQSAFQDAPELRENEALFLALIAGAKRLIYIENQYMTSPIMAEALAARLEEPDGPEVVLVSTLHCPSWFDQMTMDRTRSAFMKRLELANKHRRLHAFCPVTAEGNIIIVHAKLAIIDDDLVRIGSTNLNNRSSGFDTECDLSIEAAPPQAAATRLAIRGLRSRVVAHWLGVKETAVEAAVEKTGGLGPAIALLQAGGRPRLQPLESQDLGPLATFVAAHHIGDPIGRADAWRPWLRRRAMARKLAEQKRALADAGLKRPNTGRIRRVV
ncbi:phospholipase D-like domain-containing protein [Phenylobacterium sp. J367]|uniref:phospholipase D-like domain-containing protein n=1 Tax=Phenylobacterium sp. J367 TaxID=2898435 RepID=UPI0021512271|nr:phospholipase D-like domain-containing protein [Phenylobacterium sp. J367]MCR5877401.1 phospholipase D-like domain-containing protein [Phenylobacterium sp. J367]